MLINRQGFKTSLTDKKLFNWQKTTEQGSLYEYFRDTLTYTHTHIHTHTHTHNHTHIHTYIITYAHVVYLHKDRARIKKFPLFAGLLLTKMSKKVKSILAILALLINKSHQFYKQADQLSG